MDASSPSGAGMWWLGDRKQIIQAVDRGGKPRPRPRSARYDSSGGVRMDVRRGYLMCGGWRTSLPTRAAECAPYAPSTSSYTIRCVRSPSPLFQVICCFLCSRIDRFSTSTLVKSLEHACTCREIGASSVLMYLRYIWMCIISVHMLHICIFEFLN